jgi:hypothetical protein
MKLLAVCTVYAVKEKQASSHSVLIKLLSHVQIIIRNSELVPLTNIIDSQLIMKHLNQH